MACFLQLVDEPQSIVEMSITLDIAADENRDLEYKKAVKIQSWYRGVLTREYLKHLNECATQIQRHWRGYLGRRFCRIRVKNLVMVMRMNVYNAMAVRIQKHWRGFFTRKHVHNFYARKHYLKALVEKNEVLRAELDEFQEQQEIERKMKQEKALEKHLYYQARKNHYLVSTNQIPGIYNSPFNVETSLMEEMLQRVKPLSHKKKLKPLTDAEISKAVAKLPPVRSEKLQGPFKEPVKVHAQRFLPLNPSLRVATDYRGLENARDVLKREEWTKQLSDTPWMYSMKTSKKPYHPLLHTSSKFGHLPYGTQFFVEEKNDLNISDERFKTVASPIPLFDRFKQTYSKGTVLLQ